MVSLRMMDKAEEYLKHAQSTDDTGPIRVSPAACRIAVRHGLQVAIEFGLAAVRNGCSTLHLAHRYMHVARERFHKSGSGTGLRSIRICVTIAARLAR